MRQKGFSINIYTVHVLPRMVRSVSTDCKTQNSKKRLTLGIVDNATWQPDCVQNSDVNFCKNNKFVDRHVFNSSLCRKTVFTECQASRKEWTG